MKQQHFAENCLGISRMKLFYILRHKTSNTLNYNQIDTLDKIKIFLNANKRYLHTRVRPSNHEVIPSSKKAKNNRRKVKLTTRLQLIAFQKRKTKCLSNNKTYIQSIHKKYKKIRNKNSFALHFTKKNTRVRKLMKIKNAPIIKFIK